MISDNKISVAYAGARKLFTLKYILLGAISLPITWFSYFTVYTSYHLRRRNRLYNAFLAGDPSTFDTLSDAIKFRFGSLRETLTGRFVNVTHEWREQGIHEWLFHQVIWRPLTGKIWWNGGIGLKPSLLSDTLPQEHLDKARLRQAGRRRISNAGEESPSSGKENDKSSEDDWENLEHVKLGSNPSPEEASTQDQMLFTWFGQSTCLVQVEGITWLTDPVFGDKPVESVLAPARLRPPACSLEELLDLDLVDLVLISHDHFDHLDEDVVFALQDKVIWVIPTGLGGFLKARGVSGHRIMEMNWWEERQIVLGSRSITATCTPAQHWSGRTPWAANQTLWCGFIVKGSKTGKSFFHCGDTGYSKDLFQAIGKQYGPITLAALPIGSYHPRWIMRTVHTDPEGAVGIHRDLKIQKSVAVHHGTWIMSDEDFDDPPKELERQLGIQGIEKQKFVTLPVGRTIAV